jgi:hypothetical protein
VVGIVEYSTGIPERYGTKKSFILSVTNNGLSAGKDVRNFLFKTGWYSTKAFVEDNSFAVTTSPLWV